VWKLKWDLYLYIVKVLESINNRDLGLGFYDIIVMVLEMGLIVESRSTKCIDSSKYAVFEFIFLNIHNTNDIKTIRYAVDNQ